MQAELELQIAKVIREVDGNNTLGASALAEHIATTLLAGKVLCNAEPVAWFYTLEYGSTVVDSGLFESQRRYPFGVCGADYLARNDDGVSYVRETPLYAPASLAGNADIGKEGGK
jgi:hypothetical protein